MTMREIYDNKLMIAENNDMDSLINEFNKSDPGLRVEDNYDRTLLIDYTNSKNNVDTFHDTFGKVLKNWLQKDVTCPLKYTYNLFKLNQNQFIVRI